MPLDAQDEAQIIRYLLGDLSEEDQELVEQRYLFDSSYFEVLSALEMELIRDYHRGKLSATQRASFERKYLASPDLKRKLQIAAEIVRLSPESGPRTLPDVEGGGRRSPGEWLGSILFPGSGFYKVAMAGGLVCLLCSGVWLAWEAARMRSAVELVQLSSSPQVLSFVLSAGARSAGKATNRFLIQSGAGSVQLQLDIDTASEAGRYRAFLRNANGHVVWSADVTHREAGPGKAAILSMPASIFSPGTYTIDLQSLSADGEYRSLDQYAFVVVRQ